LERLQLDNSHLAPPDGTLLRQVILEHVIEICRAFPADDRALASVYTSHWCRSALLRAADVAIDYDTVLVLSGHATAFAYHPQRYHPLYTTPDPPEVVESRLASATGYRFESLSADGPESAWRTIVQSLEERRPIHGSYLDDVIFCGYEERDPPAARRLLVAGGWESLTWWTWDRFEKWMAEFGNMERLGTRCPVATESGILFETVAAMVRAAENDSRRTALHLDHAAYGLDGLRGFVRDMSDLTKPLEYWHPGWLGGHCVYRQISGRRAAARFLEARAADAGPTAQPLLALAAAEFNAASEAWAGWGRCLGTEAGATDAEDLRLLWLSISNRRQGADQAAVALHHETEAARHLKLALVKMAR